MNGILQYMLSLSYVYATIVREKEMEYEKSELNILYILNIQWQKSYQVNCFDLISGHNDSVTDIH